MGYALAVNHYICGNRMAFPQFAEAVRDAGIGSVGITRAALREMGIEALSRCLRENDLSVSSLNSAGFFTGTQSTTLADFSNRDMIDAAAQLAAGVLTVISGSAGDPPMPLAEANSASFRDYRTWRKQRKPRASPWDSNPFTRPMF